MRMFFAVFILFKYIDFFLQIIKKVFKLQNIFTANLRCLLCSFTAMIKQVIFLCKPV